MGRKVLAFLAAAVMVGLLVGTTSAVKNPPIYEIDVPASVAAKLVAETQRAPVAQPYFKEWGTPDRWVVALDHVESKILVTAYWASGKRENGAEVFGRLVATVFDAKTHQYKYGVAKIQEKTSGGWRKVLKLLDGDKLVQDLVEETADLLVEHPGIEHSSSECLRDASASCREAYRRAMEDCSLACDGYSPVTCEICRMAAVAAYTVCQASAALYCSLHFH